MYKIYCKNKEVYSSTDKAEFLNTLLDLVYSSWEESIHWKII